MRRLKPNSWPVLKCLAVAGGFSCALFAPSALAQAPGVLVDPVASSSDPSETYALYLPSAYSPGRKWPALLVFDPRGRAAVALEPFRAAAERHGWVVLAAHGTRSDDDWEPNERAIRALLGDVEGRWAVDLSRLYLAGFSGTSRIAWAIGRQLPGGVAGVIAVGGAPPAERVPAAGPGFAVFAAAGSTDFNYLEMRGLAARLEEAGAAHRFEVFAGPHAWPPEPVLDEAVDWLELQAMRRGLRAPEAALVAELAARWRARAEGEELGGGKAEAWVRWREVARDFAGMGELAPEVAAGLAAAEAAAGRLGRDPAVRDRRAEAERAAVWEAARRQEALEILSALRNPDTAPTPQVAGRGEALIRTLARDGKAEGELGLAAQRALAQLAVGLGFYLPRDLLARGDYSRAAMTLDLAVAAQPDDATAWYNLACARARLKQEKKALDALERAVAAGFADRRHIAADADLESIRSSPRFRALIADPPAPAAERSAS